MSVTAPTKISWPPPVRPAAVNTIKVDDLEKLISKSAFAHLAPIFTDSHYTGLTRDEWNTLLRRTNTDTLKYLPTVHDCDDFGALMRGLIPALSDTNEISWVLDYSGGHSYNIVLVVEDDGSFGLAAVEPQQDEFVPMAKFNSGKPPYEAKRGTQIW